MGTGYSPAKGAQGLTSRNIPAIRGRGSRSRERRWRYIPAVVPANALGHAHISEAPSICDGVEVFEAVFEGDGARRLGRWVAVPTAETADDPGGPSEAVGWMRVL